MPKELTPIQKEWVAALRSGLIPQGMGALGTSDGSRCCLGVACDILVKHGLIPSPIVTPGPVPSILVYSGLAGTLDGRARQFLGLRTGAGSYVTTNGNTSTLTEANDNKRLSFLQIADIIEQNAGTLFV